MAKCKQLPRLSLSRLAANDYIAFSAVLYPAVLWAISLLMAGIDLAKSVGIWQFSSVSLSLAYIAGLITFICLPLFGWRVLKLYRILKDGAEVPGKIKSISFYRDRGIVAYTYSYQGKTYRTRATLHKTKLTRSLKPEMKTILIVSKSDPRRAFIRDLYTSRPAN